MANIAAVSISHEHVIAVAAGMSNFLCAGTPSSRWMWKERSLISLSQTVQGQIPQARNLGKSESDIDDAI